MVCNRELLLLLDTDMWCLCCRYVHEVTDRSLVVQISSALKGRLLLLDSADELEELAKFPKQFTEGQPIQCRVAQVKLSIFAHL